MFLIFPKTLRLKTIFLCFLYRLSILMPELWLNWLHFSYPFFFVHFVSLKFLVDSFLPFLLKTSHFLHQSLRNLLDLLLFLFFNLWKISFDSIFVLNLRKSFGHLLCINLSKLVLSPFSLFQSHTFKLTLIDEVKIDFLGFLLWRF